jgi:exodeoxyribonuclease VII large subunit
MPLFTVRQLTEYIKDLFEADPALQDLWVEGEVSNCIRSTAGHIYFTLKDAAAELRCALWRSQIPRLEHLPANGEAVLIHGRASVYEARGYYQVYVDQVHPRGTGALFLQFQMLKERLQREGLFAAERKRSLPAFPRRVGVVTSPKGAAIHDVLKVLARRYPLAEVVVAPTAVQGEEAPPQIVAAIEALNANADVDVLIVARGGGSLEELWAFNDERVARAIFASQAPVISGVGHETDYTIADFVADVRAPTPSAAAEIAVPDQEALRGLAMRYRGDLGQALQRRLAASRAKMQHALALLGRLSPRALLDRRRQNLDDLRQGTNKAQRHRLDLLRGRLVGLALRLHTLNPKSTLRRGYAIVSRRDTGAVVTRVEQVSSGDAIEVRVCDGQFAGTVD